MQQSIIFVVIISIALFAVTAASGASRDNVSDDSLIIDDVNVKNLGQKELEIFMDALDEKFAGELDVRLFKISLEEKTTRRQRRAAFFAALGVFGKFLLKAIAKKTAMSVGEDIIREYTTDDDYYDVYETFDGLRPDNVRSTIHDSGERVMTGEIGDTEVSARSFGPSGLPTLTFRGENVVRKFQFACQKK